MAEARLRAATAIAKGGMSVVAVQMLRNSPERHREQVLANLGAVAGSVKTIAEAYAPGFEGVSTVLGVVKQVLTKAVGGLKQDRRSLAGSIGIAESFVTIYRLNPPARPAEPAPSEVRLQVEAAELISDLLGHVTRQAALALSLLDSLPPNGAEYVWTSAASLLSTAHMGCEAIEAAAIRGARSRGELLLVLEHSMLSNDKLSRGPVSLHLVNSTLAGLRTLSR